MHLKCNENENQLKNCTYFRGKAKVYQLYKQIKCGRFGVVIRYKVGKGI